MNSRASWEEGTRVRLPFTTSEMQFRPLAVHTAGGLPFYGVGREWNRGVHVFVFNSYELTTKGVRGYVIRRTESQASPQGQ